MNCVLGYTEMKSFYPEKHIDTLTYIRKCFERGNGLTMFPSTRCLGFKLYLCV